DLWNILGTIIRSSNLTVTPHGLHVIHPTLASEANDRKLALIPCTSDQNQILELLGLEKKDWMEPFGSLREMFEFCAGCRFFSVQVWADRAREATFGEGLKGSDRKRLGKREVYTRFLTEFVPEISQEDGGRFDRVVPSMEEV